MGNCVGAQPIEHKSKKQLKAERRAQEEKLAEEKRNEKLELERLAQLEQHKSQITPAELTKLSQSIYDVNLAYVYTFTLAKVVKVYDGDTFWVNAIVDGRIVLLPVRLYGIDCPEIRGGTNDSKALALAAKKHVESLILNKIVEIRPLNNTVLNGKKITEKYGRVIALVKYRGLDLTEELIRKGMGVRYLGGCKFKADESKDAN